MNKPKWTPPKWLFGPAWGVMYAAQSYSGWRVLHQVPPPGCPVLLPCSQFTFADNSHVHPRSKLLTTSGWNTVLMQMQLAAHLLICKPDRKR